MIKALYDVCAPAKLNLFLHVTGRRADGYHLIQSVFMLVDWCDTLHFELRPDGVITREDLSTVLPPDDLVLRAARALQAAGGVHAGTLQGAHIGVHKRIPAQAGMGGGSSDAATTLLALNRLWQLGLPLSKLTAIGLALGADVPFFLFGNNAWVEGVGEKMSSVAVPPARFVVAKPPHGVETAAIFSHPDLKRDTPNAIISGFAQNPFAFGRNDLQSVAQAACPGIEIGLSWLAKLDGVSAGQAGMRGQMTGSGSAVFAQVLGDLGPQETWLPAPDGFAVRLCSNMQMHPQSGWAVADERRFA